MFVFLLILTVSAELFIISNLQWGIDKWKTNYVKTNDPLNDLRLAFSKKRIIDTVKGNEYFRDGKKFNINYPDNYGYNFHAIKFRTMVPNAEKVFFEKTGPVRSVFLIL